METFLNRDEIRELSFKKTRDEYFEENEFGRKYIEQYMSDLNVLDITSDHEAKRLNGLKSFLNAARYFIAIGMEPFENDESKGLRQKIFEAVKTDNSEILQGENFPYEFADKGLKSTHFDVCDPLKKGRAEKIFLSIPDENNFPYDTQRVLLEDQEYFTNSFSRNGLELLEKLERDGKLTQNHAEKLIDDYMKEFSSRKIPVKQSTYQLIKDSKMNGLKGNTPHPEILAIGLVFSGKRNHCTLPIKGQEIIKTPDNLEKIGVPKGSPPVQFQDGLVQTSSGGVKQIGELLDDSSDEKDKKIRDILSNNNLSADDKRARLQKENLIINQDFNHEYVEYATRAIICEVEIERNGELRKETMPTWHMKDRTHRSALEIDRDHDGINTGKYDANQFESYVKEVNIIKILSDNEGKPVLYSGFKADNATNIFLGTSEGSKS